MLINVTGSDLVLAEIKLKSGSSTSSRTSSCCCCCMLFLKVQCIWKVFTTAHFSLILSFCLISPPENKPNIP